MKISLDSLAQTRIFGDILGRLAAAGDVILLTGSLGAGKTTLTQSIAAGLGVPADCYVVSPSFSLMLEYQGRLPLYHIDCYRLDSEDDVEGSGLMDYIVADGLAVVEWPERLGSLKPPEYLDILLVPEGDGTRKVKIKAVGSRWLERMDTLEEECSKASLRVDD